MYKALSWMFAGIVVTGLAGCQQKAAPSAEAKPEMTTVAPSPATAPQEAAPQTAAKAIRIDAGAAEPVKDAEGNEWQADTGFEDGDVVDRGEIEITGTKTPALYRTEHYGMTKFSTAVPNGKYLVKLHFAETYEGVTAEGERVFNVDVEGKEIKELDVFKEAGGANKALVKSVEVTVADGKLDITFTKVNEQNPEINGIEIIPQP